MNSSPKHLLVVEDDDSVRATVVMVLEQEGYRVDAVPSTRVALELLRTRTYPIVLSDIYLDEKSGLDVLRAAKLSNPNCVVIMMTGRGSIETVKQASMGGAFEYIAKPFEIDQLLNVLSRAEKSLEAYSGDDEEVDIDDLPESEMIGSSAGMIDVYKQVIKAAPTDATVLIEGETGTGKELIARMIHRESKRSAMPFVPVDCGAIAPSLLEGELFGALRGSYTGADKDRIGVLETADRGTVFLDEIGDIDQGFQLKLLRFLEEREVRQIGASRSRKIDVRVVAASNKDIPKMVEEKRFREDLWFRLNVVRIVIPPLCDRQGDVLLLAHYFLKKYNARYGQDTKLLESGVKALEVYSWPGNVRQLQHMMERLSILSPEKRIDEFAVRDAIEKMDGKESGGETLAETEAEQVRRVLAACNGNKSRAARILGIERKTLYRKLERMSLG